eukprot:tig00000241_g21020.t1
MVAFSIAPVFARSAAWTPASPSVRTSRPAAVAARPAFLGRRPASFGVSRTFQCASPAIVCKGKTKEEKVEEEKPATPKIVPMEPAKDGFSIGYFIGQLPLGTCSLPRHLWGGQLAVIVSAIGVGIVGLGMATYAQTGDAASALELTYGVPIMLIGFSMKYAELKPAKYAVEPSEEVLAARKAQCTPTLQQVRQDVTRFRYGDEQHLDETLKRLGLHPRGTEPPVLVAIREELRDGRYALVLMFTSEDVGIDTFMSLRERMAGFFGPNVKCEVSPWRVAVELEEEKTRADDDSKFAYEVKEKEGEKIEVALVSYLPTK